MSDANPAVVTRAIAFSGEAEDAIEDLHAPSCAFALDLHAPLATPGIVPDQIQRQLSQARQILGTRPGPDPTLVFPIPHIQHPVHLVLDRPMTPDRLCDPGRI